MNPTKTKLAASAVTSLFAAAGAASAAIVGNGAPVSGTAISCGVASHCYDGSSLTLTGTGALDDGGTFTATSSGTVAVPGFPNAAVTATETFAGSYSKATGVFTPTAGFLDITSCSGSFTVCNGLLSHALKPFNTGVGGALSLTAGGELTGTEFQPAGTVPPVTSSYSFVVGAFTPVSAVPLPPAAWLLGSGLLGLIGTPRRRRTALIQRRKGSR